MRRIALVVAFALALVAPAFAQKAKIEAVNAKWMELFNKGDFDGVAQLYTIDAIAFPPGATLVRGRAAIGAMWKGMAEQVANPKVTTLDVKRLKSLRSARGRHLRAHDEGTLPEGNFRQISCLVAEGPRRLETRSRYLERRQIEVSRYLSTACKVAEKSPRTTLPVPGTPTFGLSVSCVTAGDGEGVLC